MKALVTARLIALATCMISLIYACKNENSVSEKIKADHIVAARSGFWPIVQELNKNYITGFLWILIIAILVTVSVLLVLEFGIKYWISVKRQELRSITNGE